MDNRRIKFAVAIVILIGAVTWLGVSGFEEGKSYYKTADEYVKLDRAMQSRRIRLMGDVTDGTIERQSNELRFTVSLNGASVPVVYRGTDPVPDTFKDGVSVLVEGSRGDDGRFIADKIQAKCASKYEADPSKAYGDAGPA